MPNQVTKLTPNLVVSNVERSVAFYRDVLGFSVQMTVPDTTPYAFAGVTSGPVEIFFNAPESAFEEYPAFKNMMLGGTLTLFIEVTDVEGEYARLSSQVNVVMPFEKKWYGMTEFAFTDPDGYIVTYAQRTQT